ncbi:hypothetical protein D3C81_2272660 [compost metagenome]
MGQPFEVESVKPLRLLFLFIQFEQRPQRFIPKLGDGQFEPARAGRGIDRDAIDAGQINIVALMNGWLNGRRY